MMVWADIEKNRKKIFDAIHKEVYSLEGGSGIAAQKVTERVLLAVREIIEEQK